MDGTIFSRQAIFLPRIQRIEVENISIYRNKKTLRLSLNSGVTCFAGANGIGKSTLLGLLMYSLTGSAPASSREFKDVREYRSRAERESRSYFEGRISNADRYKARVGVEFTVGDKLFYVKRRFFEAESVMDFSVNGKPVLTKRDESFDSEVAKASGLRSFDQLVFLLHYVSSFDEARHLLFWDARALEQIMFMVFGDDQAALAAESARRAMERADSRVRNLQFESKKVQDRLTILSEAATTGASESDPAVIIEYESLVEERREIGVTLEAKEDEIGSATIQLAERSASIAALRQDYERLFRDTLKNTTPLADIAASSAIISDDSCPICRSAELKHRQRARQAIAKDVCPLCDTPYDEHSIDHRFAELEIISAKLEAAQVEYDDAGALRVRLLAEQQAIRENLRSLDRQIGRYDRDVDLSESDRVTVNTMGSSSDTAMAMRALNLNYKEIMLEKDRQLAQRDVQRNRLRALQDALSERYAALEREFVPTLQKLAQDFLGLEVGVRFKTSRGAKVALSLEVAGQRRTFGSQLSESQRFFIDIALRMALVDFISAEDRAELYIDTPEGSLDIAYESRAGEMFANFVAAQNDLVITANINTSALLKRLAERCKRRAMTIVSMMGWTTLSEVQQLEQPQFVAALDEVERLLDA